ncbi:MAG TPA: hypothetical protein VN281_14715 [Verrucomicrobiae bacterium]|jgi:hypothetical protein|nr:hypothetical protein [Verrucomicrobiae bacterium]
MMGDTITIQRKFVSQGFIENERTGKLIPICAEIASTAPNIETIRKHAARLFAPLAKEEPVLLITRDITA